MASIPLPVRLLASGLKGPSAPRVRTALIALPPAEYLAAPEDWVSSLSFQSHHLGLFVADQCEPHGHVRLNSTLLLDYVLSLLPNPEDSDPTKPGIWVWGIDVLLAKLSESERISFWKKLHGTASYRPPLIIALPSKLLKRFGPDDPEISWGSQRYLFLS